MPVSGVGSRAYFAQRNNEIQSIKHIDDKASDIDEEELTCNTLGVLIGKAFREFIEFFTSEGRYEKKLNKRIEALKDKNFDDYNTKIDEFYNRQIENLREKAFEGFKIQLSSFFNVGESILAQEGIDKDYPELHKQLNIIFGALKTDACEALQTLPAVLDSISIVDPQSPLEKLIIDLKNHFVDEAETKAFLNENLKDIKISLINVKKNITIANKLYKFLQPKDAYLSSTVTYLEEWKREMKNQRTAFLEILPTSANEDLIYYSFESKQITRVKKIVNLQSKEVSNEDKLQKSLANFIADKISEKNDKDMKKINESKKDLFEPFETRKKILEKEKVKAEAKLKVAQQKKNNRGEEIQQRIKKIDRELSFNNECLTILNESFQKWMKPIKDTTVTRRDSIRALTSKKKFSLIDIAQHDQKFFSTSNQVQYAIDAMLAEAAYNFLHNEVVNHKDPQPLSDDVPLKQIEETRRRAKRFVDGMQDILRVHFHPLQMKSKEENVDPKWANDVASFLEIVKPEWESLSKKYQSIVDACDDAVNPEFQAALMVSQDDEFHTDEELKEDEKYLKEIEAKGFTHHRVPGDGNCFFYACALGLESLKGAAGITDKEIISNGKNLRVALYQHIKDNPKDYLQNFVLNLTPVIKDYVVLDEAKADRALQKFAENFRPLCQIIRTYYWDSKRTANEREDIEVSIFNELLTDEKYINFYADAMAISTAYADNFELAAIANFKKVHIIVHSLDYQKIGGSLKFTLENGKAKGTINLYRPKYEAHYNYLEPKV